MVNSLVENSTFCYSSHTDNQQLVREDHEHNEKEPEDAWQARSSTTAHGGTEEAGLEEVIQPTHN